MLKKSFSLVAILGIASISFAQNLEIEKAVRFRAVESEAGTDGEESDAGATASEESSLAPPASEENPFDLSQGVDPLQMLGGSAQLEELGLSYYYAPSYRPRVCWMCRWYICC